MGNKLKRLFDRPGFAKNERRKKALRQCLHTPEIYAKAVDILKNSKEWRKAANIDDEAAQKLIEMFSKPVSAKVLQMIEALKSKIY